MQGFKKTIVIVGTLDTKSEEILFLKKLIEERGHRVLVIDVGVKGRPGFTPDISREEVAHAAGADVIQLAAAGDRGAALAKMSAGLVSVVVNLHSRGELDGISGLGGGSGTAVASAAMRALPFGMPKFLVSTKGAGDVSSYVGTKDIVILNSVTDILGLNPILSRVLVNAAGAIAGMVESEAVEEPLGLSVGLTSFGTTTPAVMRCCSLLKKAGYETLVFHACGSGGRTMEELIEKGAIDAVIDLTTTELADELCGGKQSAGPQRLEAAGWRGIPQVVAPGAMDMVNFGPPETVPSKYSSRLLYRHNPNTTVMRTTVEENATLGRWVGEKVSKSKGPVVVLLPLKGFSEYDAEGEVFFDPRADAAFMDGVAKNVGSRVEVVMVDAHINSPVFAETAVGHLLRLLGKKQIAKG